MTDPTPAEALKAGEPCGGCGATESSQRCMGCLHDFGTPDSAWVQKYHAPVSPPPDAGEVREKVARAKASLLHLEMFAEGDDIKRVRDAIAAIALLAPSPPTPDAGEVRTYRDGVEAACVAFEQVVIDGYPEPVGNAKCAHDRYSYEGCIACYDVALTASIAAIRKLP